MLKKRNTIQRRFVYEALCDIGDHPTAEEIYTRASAAHPHISKGTVYRNLNSLAEDGEILRIHIPNAPDKFDHHIHAHYHIKCKRCDSFFDIGAEHLKGIDKQIFDATGFVVKEHDLVFSGICPACQKAIIKN